MCAEETLDAVLRVKTAGVVDGRVTGETDFALVLAADVLEDIAVFGKDFGSGVGAESTERRQQPLGETRLGENDDFRAPARHRVNRDVSTGG